MTRQQAHILVILLAMVAIVAAWAPAAQAQQGVYYAASPIVYQVHYHRVYQGSAWYWSPVWGWHTHARYVDVPYWSPSSYVYPQPLPLPAGTTYVIR